MRTYCASDVKLSSPHYQKDKPPFPQRMAIKYFNINISFKGNRGCSRLSWVPEG